MLLVSIVQKAAKLSAFLALGALLGCGRTAGTPASTPPDTPTAGETLFACKPESTTAWQRLGHAPYNTICSMARDPLHPEQLLGYNSLGWFTSRNEGDSWCELDSDLVPLANDEGLELAASPAYPGLLFANMGPLAGLVLHRQPDGSVTSEMTDVWDVQVDPFDPERLFALGPGGVVVSVDGEHFEEQAGTSQDAHPLLMQLALDPSREGVMYGLDPVMGSFWSSLDEGRNWSQVTPPFDFGTARQLTLVGSNPSLIYLSSHLSDVAARSSDGGATFERVAAPRGEIFAPDAANIWGGSCGPPLFDPGDAERLLLPTVFGLLQVEQGKVVGQRASHLLPGPSGFTATLSKAAADDLHLAAVAGGYLLLSSDAGDKFDVQELEPTVASAVYDHASPPGLFVELQAEPGLIAEARYSANFGADFQPLDLKGLHGLRVDELVQGTLYAASEAGSADAADGACWFSRSQDLGASWSCIWPPTNAVPELCGGDYPPAYDRCSEVTFATDPSDAQTLFVLSGGELPGRVGKSTDAGSTWQRVGPELTAGPGNQAAWVFKPQAPNELLISGAFPPATWASRDAGATWDQLNQLFVASPVSDPTDRSVLYGVPSAGPGSHRVSRSQDSGARWGDISGDLPACRSDYTSILAPAPAPSRALYVGTCGGWFKSDSAR
jgi:hypothetical protein